jgi:hypothetical protein
MIGEMITKSAINTVSYYMLEFNDAFNEGWMMGFDNYRENGFKDGLWTNYIEKMINMDKHTIEVCMAVLRRRGSHQIVDARRSGARGENGELLTGAPARTKVPHTVGAYGSF